jgi:hypothetical protein
MATRDFGAVPCLTQLSIKSPYPTVPGGVPFFLASVSQPSHFVLYDAASRSPAFGCAASTGRVTQTASAPTLANTTARITQFLLKGKSPSHRSGLQQGTIVGLGRPALIGIPTRGGGVGSRTRARRDAGRFPPLGEEGPCHSRLQLIGPPCSPWMQRERVINIAQTPLRHEPYALTFKSAALASNEGSFRLRMHWGTANNASPAGEQVG